jgi:peptidoglycan glycosyltransferase
MDVRTGEVLAAVSYPWPEDGVFTGNGRFDPQARLDRVRYGVYPPGSTFKLVTAAAALTLRPELSSSQFMCVRLPDGRIGARVPGSTRPVRDDALDATPHGNIGLDEAIRHSCNAYFAQLGQQLGTDPLIDMASRFHIDVARPNTPQRLRPQLPYAAFGQGEALASPMRLLTVTAAIAGGGQLVEPRWILDSSAPPAAAITVLPRAAADRLARDMAMAVTSGTGRSLAGVKPAIAGKTGTAEVTGGRSHAWFTGFAPYGGTTGRTIAFVVLVENGGYGARAAAPIAGELVAAARELDLF